ncbi:hypothetical protein Pmani_011802 [Petrolisthes manimaculis]|uniref:Uncharacterized protein n=1 Tax=Petrolisthes manimaculis TaxID=1843537 RepID=A0AAE1PYY4_9EUCA|nr:hypothetical protein Pmani_011802 [Petrolisthes manimaculis]
MLGIRTEGCKNGGVMETEEKEKEKKVDGSKATHSIHSPLSFQPDSSYRSFTIGTTTPPSHPTTPSSSTDTRVSNKFPRTFMDEELKASDPTSLTLKLMAKVEE